MDLSDVIKAVLAPFESQKSDDGLHRFHPGDNLLGRVLKIEEDGRVLMDLGRTRVLARIGFPIQPEQVLSLRVVGTGKILHLRAESSEAQMQTARLPIIDFSSVLTSGQQTLLTRLAERLAPLNDAIPNKLTAFKAIQHACRRVSALSVEISLEEPVDRITNLIKTVLEDQGVLFEKHMADKLAKDGGMPATQRSVEVSRLQTALLASRDVKANLLILKEFLTNGDEQQQAALKLNPKQVDELQDIVERLLKHVEQQQQQAVARWETGETRQVLVHVMPLANQQAPVQFKVYYNKKNSEKKGTLPQQIALLLDLDNLGAVRVDLALIAEKLHVRFFVDSEQIMTRFRKELNSVEAALSTFFNRVQCDIFISPEKIAQFYKEDEPAAVSGRIDITA